METPSKHYVYRQDVIEFVTIGVQFCIQLEKSDEIGKKELVDQLTKLLPMLYLKTRLISKPEAEMDGFVERFCTEDDYSHIEDSIKRKLGTDDAYLEVFMEDMRYSDEPLTAFISENLADIYQEMRDLALNYQTGETSVMNDAILACLEAFSEHWGQKLLNVLRALNVLLNDPDFAANENED